MRTLYSESASPLSRTTIQTQNQILGHEQAKKNGDYPSPSPKFAFDNAGPYHTPNNLPRTVSHQKEQKDTMDLPYRLKTPMAVTEWDPTQFFREGYPSSPYALLILNHPINEKAYDVLQRHGELPRYPLST